MSSDEQQESGAGLEAQRRALAAECKRRGWRPVEVAADAGFSAKDLNRPAIQEAPPLLETADLEALVVAKRDRLSRSLQEITALIASAQTQGWALVALDCALATTTAAGEPTGNVLASFAPFERRLISQRTREALAVKRAQGVRLGRPPTMSPYALDRITSERAAGKSLTAIANGLNTDRIPTAQGGRRWYPATVRHTLNRAR